MKKLERSGLKKPKMYGVAAALNMMGSEVVVIASSMHDLQLASNLLLENVNFHLKAELCKNVELKKDARVKS